MPEAFPYHPHWKADACHLAFWQLMPSLDHRVPIALGGPDTIDNWVTTSGIRNQVKGLATLEEMGWSEFPPGDIAQWDGLSRIFLQLAEKNPSLLDDQMVRDWYQATKARFL